MIQLTINQLKEILKNNGASIDFKTGKDTKKRGFIVSLKDTEAIIKDAVKMDVNELLKQVNEILKNNTYNAESNKNNILGFWIDDGALFIDVSKCLKVNKNNFYLVKNEAFINNQYAVYNNETNETYKLILPIYTLYNTSDLLGTPQTNDIINYSKDFYYYKDILKYLHIQDNGHATKMIFESVDEIPETYENKYVIIKDLSNYTRDIIEDDVNIDLKEALKNSRLIKEV